MEQKILEEVLRYLAPQFKYVMSFIFNKSDDFESLKKRILEGLEKDYITFSDDTSLDIDMKKIETEKGKEWANSLRKQIKYLLETIQSIRK